MRNLRIRTSLDLTRPGGTPAEPDPVRVTLAVDRERSGKGRHMTDFKKGDKVKWNSHGGEAVGEVVRKITEDTEAAGRQVRASKEEPQYEVRSEKSGGTAVHKPDALKRAS
jgi:hypothetical protein